MPLPVIINPMITSKIPASNDLQVLVQEFFP